jgi:hypothetical protein
MGWYLSPSGALGAGTWAICGVSAWNGFFTRLSSGFKLRNPGL